jgi:hypothetical protein
LTKLPGQPLFAALISAGDVARSPLFFRAFIYWLLRYTIGLGFLDGIEGLIFHFLQGFWYRFLVDAKIYEIQKQHLEPANEAQHPGQ